jgi:hypothetical protein
LTLIIGYIHSDSTVHIVADSAVTLLTKQTNPSSKNEKTNSFGEIIENIDDKIVTESAQKIYNIQNSIIATFSGESIEGKQVLEDLKFEINTTEKIKKTDIISNYFELRKPTLTEYIIGFSENNIPKLYYYKNKGTLISEKGGYIILGSGSENKFLTVPLIITLEKFYNIKSHPRNLLIFIIALVQCCSLNSLTFFKGVGGFFNGATLFNNRIYWASDSCNILYSSKHFEKAERFIVNKFNRENVTFLTSPKIKKRPFFPELHWLEFTPNQWLEKWIDKLLELNKNLDVHYFVFICYDRRIITVVNKKSDRFLENLKINRIDEINIDFGFSKNMLEKLLSFVVEEKTNKEPLDGFGVQFNYI